MATNVDPKRSEAAKKAAQTRLANKAAAAQRQNRRNWWLWLLAAIPVIAALAFLGWRSWLSYQTPPVSDASGAGLGVVNNLTSTPEASAPTPTSETNTPVQADEVNFNAPLAITLDQFGSNTSYSERFPLGDGKIWDQSYLEGQIFVANGYAFHDNGFVSQNGCNVLYYQAPMGGGRVRFVGWDGMGFEVTNGSVTLEQAIAAMRETLTRAHGCDTDNIQYHQVIRFGDPVK